MPQCKTCDQRIEFIKLQTGKWMPVEEDSVPLDELNGGETVVTEEGEVFKYDPEETYNVEEVFISHFAKCPGADTHRKPRTK